MDLRDLGQAKKVESAALVPREQSFSVKYETANETREVVLTSRVMNGDEKVRVWRIVADLVGRDFNLLPGSVQLHAMALGTLAVQLRNPPEWVLNAIQEDEELAVALFASCREHEARWFRSGERSSEAGEERPRISISEIGTAPHTDEREASESSPYGGRRLG